MNCKCGCGKAVTLYRGRYRDFITGHCRRGVVFSEEHRKKIGDALRNIKRKPLTTETKNKISIALLGKNKGKILSLEHRRKLSESHKGKTSHRKGKKVSLESRRKMSLSQTGKVGWKNNFYGKHHTDETKLKISKTHKGLLLGDRHPNWQGGVSFEPYAKEFNDGLRELIRKRDNYRCQQCFRHQNEDKNNRRLTIHHIDYNKKNNNPENLISLCNCCHVQTNYKREDWMNYFKNKIKEANYVN